MKRLFMVSLQFLGCLAMSLHVVSASAAETSVPPKGPPPAGLRVGFMAYWQTETELVIKAAGIENHRRVDAACASLHPTTFSQGGAATVPEKSRAALEKGDVDAQLICTWTSYPPRWYARLGEKSSLSELAALGAKNNEEFRILWTAYLMPIFKKHPDPHSGFNLKATRELLAGYRKLLEEQVDAVNARHGRRVACIVPLADAALALMDEIVAGKVPGITDPGDLLPAVINGEHGPQLRALGAYCHYATLYRASPEGLTVPFGEFKIKPKGAEMINFGLLPPAQDAILQRIAWETVSKYPYAGVAVDKDQTR